MVSGASVSSLNRFLSFFDSGLLLGCHAASQHRRLPPLAVSLLRPAELWPRYASLEVQGNYQEEK
eukprot:753118-Hanusia_phi.AAC.3